MNHDLLLHRLKLLNFGVILSLYLMKNHFAILSVAIGLSGAVHADAPVKLEVGKESHIAIIGNGFADRMQHDGTLEALIHKANPQADISIRNLGFATDEITSNMRSDGVQPPNEWLTKVKADVVLAFWGFNESFKGVEGLDKFKADLEKYLKEMLVKNYSGKGAPRIVLVSPIAQEKPIDPNYPDAKVNNANLKLYTAAMAEVAKANQIQFIDLYAPSDKLYQSASKPLTHNGIHMTVAGYQALAPILYQAIFGAEPPSADSALETIRKAVQVKNEMWLSYYRTVDQFNIYGGRSTIGYNSGPGGPKIDNRAVLWPELAVRNVMTENREKRVWALAKGGDLQIDDSNVPQIPKIKSNKPGQNPDGSYRYTKAEEAIKLMTVPKGVKVELVASEEQFPELVSPVQMGWDTKGRLWISAWKNYPERSPLSKEGDKLLILDIGADGKATKCTTYLDNLNCPTGFQFYKDGVVVMESPDLWYARDTDGDGKGELVERVLNGLDAADSHHETNSMALEPGGAIYLSDGVFHRTQVETSWGPVRNRDGAIYRWEPRSGRFERYVAYGFANPHGKVFDYWGNDIITDGTGNNNYYAPAFSGHIDFPNTHSGLKDFWGRPSRPCAGTHILSSRAWPAEFQGNFLNCNVIGMQGIFRAKITAESSGLKGETLENLVSSKDPNFRPSGVSVAPDGSIYFMDWHKPLIGHLQHHLRDPNRDQDHGRIYRLTFEGMPLLKPAVIAGQPIEKLLDLLKEPENNVRERTKIELGARDTKAVMAAVDLWVAALDKMDPAYEHHVLEALWVKQYHNVVDVPLIRRVLESPEPRARAQAARVVCYQRESIPEATTLLKVAAGDVNPRVRLEAIRAASFFAGKDLPAAYEIIYGSLKHQGDYYIDYTYKETMRQLGLLSKDVPLPQDPVVLAAMVERMSDADLAKAAPSEIVLLSRIERQSTGLDQRGKALDDLAKLHKTDRVVELLAALQRVDTVGGRTSDELAKLLGAADPKALAPVRAGLVVLAEKATKPGVRTAAWAALITADANAQTTWATAQTDGAREALIQALSNQPDPTLRAKFQPMLVSTLGNEKVSAGLRSAALLALPLTGVDNAKVNFATLASHIQRGMERTAAVRAITQLPRGSWDKTLAGPLTASLLAWAQTVPADQRSSQEFIEALQFGTEMAALLPEADAQKIRKDLRGLGVRIFVVKTVREQMRYDITQLVVEAGKPFEIILENLDAMPHNLVVVKPGQRQKVSESVQALVPTKLDKKGRAYVPENDANVLGATKLVEAGQKETIKMTAPAEPGDYEYVCTFPGHWQIMWGKIAVVADLDSYTPPAVPVAEPKAAIDHSAHQHAAAK